MSILVEAEEIMVMVEVDMVSEEASEIIRDQDQPTNHIKQTSLMKKIKWQLKSEDFHIKQGMKKFPISLKIINMLKGV